MNVLYELRDLRDPVILSKMASMFMSVSYIQQFPDTMI